MRWLLAIFFLFLLIIPIKAQVGVCSQWSFGETTAVTPITQIVPAISNASVHICGLVFFATSANADITLYSGTGTNCATNQQALTPTLTVGPNGPLVLFNQSPIMKTDPGTALCGSYDSKNTGTLDWMIFWAQY